MLDVDQHLQTEIARPDPWGLESNVFEHRRYAAMLNMIRSRGPFSRGLEIGCAGGFFTNFLLQHCRALHLVDVRPESLDRVSRRLAAPDRVTCEAASAADAFAAGATFDLVVAAEVLCYLPDLETLRRAVDRIAAKVAPGGLLIFGSAVDQTCRRWGLFAGAETAMREWERSMIELDRAVVKGSYWGEDSRIVAYQPKRPGDGFDPARAPVRFAEDHFMPHAAVDVIPAASVVVLAPHPDDEVLGCGGSLAAHAARQVPVTVVVATDGAPESVGANAGTLGRRRREESCAAAQTLGCGAPVFWNLPDRDLRYGEALIQRVMGAIAGADLVHAPSLREIHPDHLSLGLAAVEAVRRIGAGVRLAFYEVGSPLSPNVLVDITALEAKKRAAMACFASQLEQRDYAEQIAALNRYRSFSLSPQVRAAEAYLLVSAEEIVRDPLKFHRTDDERRITEAAERAVRRVVTEMQNSTSWRITAPLRAASIAIRRFLESGPSAVTRPLRAALKGVRALMHRSFFSA